MRETLGRVPSKDYRRQYEALWPELGPELARVFLEEEPVLGASVRTFEAEFASYHGAPSAVGVGSGTAAIYLALRALGIGEGDEVVTAANTFIATVSAIRMTGATPCLVDPDEQTMNVTAAACRAACGPRTRAVLPVHLYGRLAPVGDIAELCRDLGPALVEDAAQAHGAHDESQRYAGSFGDFGCFSFHPSKNLGAFGDGGMILCKHAGAAEELRVLRNLGKQSKHEVVHIAPNSKLDTLQAALLRVKLRRLDEHNARRRHLAASYDQLLGDIDELRLPEPAPSGSHVHHLYVVRSAKRDELRAFLADRGVRASLHYPVPPHLQPLGLGYRRGDFPIAERCAESVLSLPISPELSDDEIGQVARLVRDFHGC